MLLIVHVVDVVGQYVWIIRCIESEGVVVPHEQGVIAEVLVDLLLTRSNDQVRALIHPDRGCLAVKLASGPPSRSTIRERWGQRLN
jgi:hypothetical protein